MTVLAALIRVISNALPSSDLLFAYVSSGRFAPLPGIEACVGPTLSLLPLRIQLPGRCDKDWADGDDRTLLEHDAIRIQEEIDRVIPYEASGTDACRRIDPMPMEIVVQPSRSLLRSDEQDDIRMEHASGIGGGSAIRGNFLLEVSFADGANAAGTIFARWDRRAATSIIVDGLLHRAIDILRSISNPDSAVAEVHCN